MQSLLQAKGLEYVIDQVGGQNKYQIRGLGVILLQHIFKVFFIMYYPFMNRAPIFVCTDAFGQEYDCTENDGGCIDKRIAEHSPNGLVTDLGLYCEYSYVRTIANILFFAGGNIGSAYFSYISDKSGRKSALFQQYLLISVSMLLLGVASVGPVTYIALLMFVWSSMSGHFAITLTYLAEIGNQKFSRISSVVVLLILPVAELGVIFIAYFVTSWKLLVICFISVPALVVTVLTSFLDETPAYFYSKKDLPNTVSTLRKIAQVNNKPMIEEDISVDPATPTTATSTKSDNLIPTKSWNYIEIMRHPELRLRVITYSVVKVYLYLAFYGCYFALASLGGSIYVNTTVAAVAEALGYILSYLVSSYAIRPLLKRSLQIVVISGLSFLLVPLFECDGFFMCSTLFLQGMLALVMRAAICFVYGFIYNLGNDLFPAEVRSQSIGLTEIAAFFGGIIAPLIIVFAETYKVNALFLFGTLGFVALVASHYVPDTPLTSLGEKDEGVEMHYVKLKDKGCSEL